MHPSGRCSLLAQKLWQVTREATKSLQLAQALFDNQHRHDNPAEVTVANPDGLKALQAICGELGIFVEVSEP
jgi:hypothetical protein